MRGIEPLGDCGFLARFASEREASAWAAAVRERRWPEVLDVVAAYRAVAVFPDVESVDWDGLHRRLRELVPAAGAIAAGRTIELPVCYDGADLAAVAERTGLTADDVIAAHAGQEYTVFAVGFLPGFPYAGYLPECLTGVPRRASPRTRVPAGSVAIAGVQTGVYPIDSPGGWALIGRTPLSIVDLSDEYFPIRAGDRLRFVPITAAEYERRQGERLP